MLSEIKITLKDLLIDQTQKKREKRKKKRIQDQRNNLEQLSICIISVGEGKDKTEAQKKYLKISCDNER